MKFLKFYEEALSLSNDEEVFNYLINNLKPSNLHWNYFVNWDKVFSNIKDIEIHLNTLNYLIGKEDFDKEFRFLAEKHPSVISVIPLLAVRGDNISERFQILIDYSHKRLHYKEFNFSKEKPNYEDVSSYIEFIEKTGLKELMVNRKVKNLVDYMIGVEAGLDSNARKNRSGHTMENIIELFIKDVCRKNDFVYLKEANAKKNKR